MPRSTRSFSQPAIETFKFPSRRFALLAISVSPLLALEGGHFWDKEDPSKWTADQIRQLTTDSPWAVSVNAELKSNDSNMASSAPRVSGRGGRRGVTSEGGATQTLPKLQAVIRWASAKPVREALHLTFPQSLSGHHVISVSGLPMISAQDSDSGGDPFAALKEQTFVEVKRGEQIQPGVAYQDPDDTSTIYFGFLPSLVPIAEAKTAIFQMDTGPLAARAKFNFSRMKYKGELAV